MKKRNLLTVMLIALLAFTLGMGTLAYYTKTFTSNGNIVRAAKFEIDTNGTLDKDVEFDLTDTPLYPGVKEDVYEFEIHKNNTEVPVKYEVTVIGLEDLFEPVEQGNSPVELTVYREVEGEWTKLNDREFIPTEDIESFKIYLEWNHSDYDIEYQGKTGKINIQVVATQIDPEEPPVEERKIIATYSRIAIGGPTGKSSVLVKVDAYGFGGSAKTFSIDCILNGKNFSHKEASLEEKKGIGLIFTRDEVKFSDVTIQIHDENGNVLETFMNVPITAE